MNKKNKKTIVAAVIAVLFIISAAFTFFAKDGWKSVLQKTDESTAAIGRLTESEAAKQSLSVHYIDVDQGDSTLIQFGDYHILIDCAKKAYCENVLTYLESMNIDSLDLVIATHPDADHIGGFTDLLNQIKPNLFILPQISSKIEKTKTELTLINTLKTMKVKTEYAVHEKVYTFGELTLTTYLTGVEHTDKNDYSVVTKIEYGDASYLFMGDAGKTVENEFMKQKEPLRADVLKAGHHGSSKSSSNKFVKYVSPKYCVFSCGVDNDYGHPHNEVLEIMKKQKVQCLRTDISGSVIIGSDGQRYIIATEK